MFTPWETVQRTGGFLSGKLETELYSWVRGGAKDILLRQISANSLFRHQPLGMLAQVANQQGKHLANSLNRLKIF